MKAPAVFQKKAWRHGIAAICMLLWAGLTFYFSLPALNWRHSSFWSWLFGIAFAYVAVYILLSLWSGMGRFFDFFPQKGKFFDKTTPRHAKRNLLILVGALALFAVTVIVLNVASSRLAAADRYHGMLTVKESDFSADIAELPLSQIPVVDYDTAQRLGSRKIGEVVELVSQFNISHYYTQINYRNAPNRVSPLEYAGIIKWFNNRADGIPYYVRIDMASQETELVHLEQGMKYAPCEYFSRDLERHLRFAYPTKMFEEFSFEIDDNGHPYWIVPYYTYTINILGGRDIAGILLTDAVTGETMDYKINEVPQWIDRVYPEALIVEQVDNWGSLSNGYWNTIFGQKNVITSTDGHNFIALNDDIWLYTGLTSVVMDESNIGFILVNLRTKEARTYTINGAEEYSAMESAQGKVQEKGYSATFPILINVEGVPSYFLSLKDKAGLVKAYAFVSVAEYQIVGVGDTVSAAQSEYLRLLDIQKEDAPSAPGEGDTELTATVTAIAQAVLDGNTTYYLELNGKIYTASVTLDRRLPFLKAGDTVKITVDDKDRVTSLLAVNP